MTEQEKNTGPKRLKRVPLQLTSEDGTAKIVKALIDEEATFSWFLDSERIWKILLAVQRAGQQIPARYSPTYDGDSFIFDERTASHLNALAGQILVAYTRQKTVLRDAAHYRTRRRHISYVKQQASDLIAALARPEVADLHVKSWNAILDEQFSGEERVLVTDQVRTAVKRLIAETNELLRKYDEKITKNEHQSYWGSDGQEAFVVSLAHIFRSYVAEDPQWMPKPSFSKSQGADPFSVFISAIRQVSGKPITEQSAKTVVQKILSKRLI